MRRRAVGLAIAISIMSACAAAPVAGAAGRCGEPAQRPWCDTSLSPDARADLLLGALTPDERISLLGGDDVVGVMGGAHQHTGTSNGVDRVGLPTTYYSDGPVGPRQGQATGLPIPMGLAATFDPRLAYAHGSVAANEARDKGNDVIFGPTVNIMRTPLGGRTFEAYGEDPFLDARMTVGWINGAQSQGVIGDVKHFAANNQEGQAGPAGSLSGPGQPLGPPAIQGNRFTVNANVDERTLREVYLQQFEAAVKEAHVGTVMCAYNRLNTQYACENPHLLLDILKREWGFQGYVLADYGAAHDTRASLAGGLDFEPFPGVVYGPVAVRAALLTGATTMPVIDEHVHRILRTLFAYGFFDREAYRDDDSQIDKQGHAQTSQRIEESAVTLLKNGGALPLGQPRSIAVIGSDADSYKTGGGSSNVVPFFYTTPLQAIADRAGPAAQVRYDPGSNADQAAAAARGADVAIVFASDYQTEGTDRTCLTLECGNSQRGDQDGLISRVAAANPNTIVVLETGGPVLTPWRDQVKGLLEAWYPGEEGGPAIARVLFGDVNPGGRLPATFPNQEGDLPTAGDPASYPGVAENETYKEGIFVGYRSYEARNLAPAFPFGAGLSYTSFAYSGFGATAPDQAGISTVSFTIRNNGARSGDEVPQVYLGAAAGSPVPEPPKWLAGFERITLGPGQSRRMTITIARRSRQYFDVQTNAWRDLPGCLPVAVGASSGDIRLRGTLCGAAGSTSLLCRAGRSVTIRLRQPRHGRIVKATAYVNGRRTALAHGRRLATITLGAPGPSFAVRVVASTSDHRQLVTGYRFRGCRQVSARARRGLTRRRRAIPRLTG
ncbi:MAG: glycoside hydrolase family 3 C-terminal domain-containing protein [Thermoleophilaceae bacterium]